MTVFVVAYDLNDEAIRPNITDERDKTAWAKLSESSYAIKTDETAEQVFDRFKPYLDLNDNLYVIPLKKPYHGLGPKEVIDWLDANLAY